MRDVRAILIVSAVAVAGILFTNSVSLARGFFARPQDVAAPRIDGVLLDDVSYSSQWPLAHMSVPVLWQQGHHGSHDVIVAILGSGFDWNSIDMAGNVFVNEAESGDASDNGIDDDHNGLVDDYRGWNFVDSTRDVWAYSELTNAAALAMGARAGNRVGVVGINWATQILPVRILDGRGASTPDRVARGIDYAWSMGAKVILCLWAGATTSPELEAAVARARSAGALIVAPAGDSGVDLDRTRVYPASIESDGILAVGASDSQRRRMTGSNYGLNSIDLFAPGELMRDAGAVGNPSHLAAANAAGVAALVRAAWDRTQITLSVNDWRERIVNGCTRAHALRGLARCEGVIDALNTFVGTHTAPAWPQEDQWIDFAYRFESAHPYGATTDIRGEARIPGARFVRAVIDAYDIEDPYDRLTISDAQDIAAETITGAGGARATAFVTGETIRFRLTSDASVHKWGFAVTKLQFVR